MRERCKLRALRSDLTHRIDFIVLDFKDVDFRSTAPCGGGWTWMVRVGAGTGRETLAWEPAKGVVVFGLGVRGADGGCGGGCVWVGLVRKRPDIARVVSVWPRSSCGRWVAWPCEISNRPRAGPISLRVFVWARQGNRHFDVPARKAEFVPGLEHAGAVG